MDLTLLVFYVFAAVAGMAAIGVISVKNPVHAAMLLVLTFFSVACTWIMASAEFLGVALILVYVGAVLVLFLFVVMMLDVDIAAVREGFVRYLPIGLIVAVIMLVEIVTLIGVKSQLTGFSADAVAASGTSNTKWLARELFTHYLLPFEIAAVILTVAVIAAVTLTLRKRTGTHKQNPSAQVRVQARDRMRMVKMKAEVPATPAPAEGEGAT